MMKQLLSFILALCLTIGMVAAFSWPVCIDMKNPSAPTNVVLSGDDLSWNAAADDPDCSDIDYYEIYKDDVLMGTTSELFYNDVGTSGTFKVIAVDLAGNKGEAGVATTGGSGGGGSGGGGGGRSGRGSSGGSTIIPTGNASSYNITDDGNETEEDKGGKDNDNETSGSSYILDNTIDVNGTGEDGNQITGAVIGGGTLAWWALFAVLIALGAAYLIFFFVKKKNEKDYK